MGFRAEPWSRPGAVEATQWILKAAPQETRKQNVLGAAAKRETSLARRLCWRGKKRG